MFKLNVARMAAYILFEHAAGYALFKNIAMEDIGSQLDQVQAAVLDLAKFGKVVKLESFLPFKSGANALENINSISEGVVHDDLKNFLETMLPKKAGKLGVSDSRIAGSITEDLDIECDFGGVVAEILRGIRFHFAKFVEGLSAKNCEKAQLGLGHSYSRCKVKFNVHRVDNMIIQSIALLDQIDKDINTFSMRLREWYSYHYPELIKIVPDNVMYAKVVSCIKSRKDLTEESVVKLEEILMDSAKAKAVYESAKISMGMDISPIDLINIQSFTTRIIALNEYRSKLSGYLGEKMNQCAPNLTALIGNQVRDEMLSKMEDFDRSVRDELKLLSDTVTAVQDSIPSQITEVKEDVNSRMSDMEIRISEQLAKEIHETQEQIEVVAETVVEARVQKTEETAETLTKTCRGLEEDLASECENRKNDLSKIHAEIAVKQDKLSHEKDLNSIRGEIADSNNNVYEVEEKMTIIEANCEEAVKKLTEQVETVKNQLKELSNRPIDDKLASLIRDVEDIREELNSLKSTKTPTQPPQKQDLELPVKSPQTTQQSTPIKNTPPSQVAPPRNTPPSLPKPIATPDKNSETLIPQQL